MTTRAGADMPKFDVSSETIGAYFQKVDGLEKTMVQFANTVDRGFDNIRNENKAANDVLSQSIGALSAKFDARSQPQYNMMLTAGGLILAFICSLGAVVYTPMRTDVNNLYTKLDIEFSRAASHQEVSDAATQLKTVIDQRLDETSKRDDAMTADIDRRVPREVDELRWQWMEKRIDAMRGSKPKG